MVDCALCRQSNKRTLLLLLLLDLDMMQIVLISMKNGEAISWMSTCRYLGVYFVSGRELKCCFDQAKRNFFRPFNAIFRKVGRSASE